MLCLPKTAWPPTCARREKHRPGRGIGSGLGKTGGRGHKGLTSRSGGKVAPGFEGGQQPLHRRLPKFGFVSLKAMDRAEVRTSELAKVEGDVVSLQTLKDANLINQHVQRVKVMLSGEVGRAVTLKGIAATKGARAAIEAVGGKFED
ncbi:50S ribosomal protein L15 [Pseudomonas aeruginosa]|uniref:50S ribosomal protein L15 n=2 Tax=Gammaproteobacteria TaxID=1236 RepID=UPI00301E3E5F